VKPKVIKNINQLRDFLIKNVGVQRLGFVPTMGFLHDGHLSLVERSVKENAHTVVSIFVNPSQFGPSEDLTTYPRNIKRDIALLSRFKNIIIFAPTAEEIYPPDHRTWITVSDLSELYCGASRPGHFRGVATIVCKLHNLIAPHIMYLGEKDFQQCYILEQMLRDLNIYALIQRCPIVREADGLALSSRNTYLSPSERERALCLHNSLIAAKEMVASGERNIDKINAKMIDIIYQAQGNIDYIAFINEETFQPESAITPHTRILLAVKIGTTRLIDNMKMSNPLSLEGKRALPEYAHKGGMGGF